MKQAIVLLVAMAMVVPALALAGEAKPTGGEAAQGTTVRSGKSNADNRAGGGTGGSADAAAGDSVQRPKGGKDSGGERGTTVKSSKSNGSE